MVLPLLPLTSYTHEPVPLESYFWQLETMSRPLADDGAMKFCAVPVPPDRSVQRSIEIVPKAPQTLNRLVVLLVESKHPMKLKFITRVFILLTLIIP